MFENKPVKTSRKAKIIITAVLCLSLGLFIGAGGALTYNNYKLTSLAEDNEIQRLDLEAQLESLNDELDSLIEENSSQQNELATNLDSLTAELSSLNTDVVELSDTTDAVMECSNTIPVTTSEYSENIQSVAEEVMPSVVGVRTVSIQTASSFFFSGRSTTQEVVGVGTGVIVSEDGLILTNQHVVTDNPKSITVTLMDGSEHEADVIYADGAMDLAVIKIDAAGLPTSTLGDSEDISVGEVTIAIGNPLGLEYERSVTAGIVSAVDRVIQLDQYEFATNLIQTDAAINSGNSGGPLLNSSGEVIGINTYKLSYGEGMGFAIPINAAIPIIEQVVDTGDFSQAKIGGSFIDQNIYALFDESQLEESGMLGIGYEQGLLAVDINEDSNAYESGLRTNDILLSIDSQEVNTLLELRTILYSHSAGETVELTVQRDGEILELAVELYEST